MKSYTLRPDTFTLNVQYYSSRYVEIIEGIKTFFERALGSILLYRFERLQYEAVKAEHPEASLVDVYGVQHLLRLFVKLPQLLSGSDVGEDDMTVIKQKLHEFLKFINKTTNKLFTDTAYEPADADYLAQYNDQC